MIPQQGVPRPGPREVAFGVGRKSQKRWDVGEIRRVY